MRISLSLDIEAPAPSRLPQLNGPVTIHDSRFIAQMMDRALPRTSSHTRIEAAYPPQRTIRMRKRFVDRTI